MTPQDIAEKDLETCNTLFPDPRLVHFGARNSTYWHSLFIGLTAPILNFPVMLWQCILRHVLFGAIAISLFAWTCFWMGITGRAQGLALKEKIDSFD